MANLLSSDAVADFFLLQIDSSAGDSITNLKLQKLVYYAQAWHLGLHGKPLFAGEIQAWAHGPVVPELYRRFRRYGWGAIDPHDLRIAPYDELHRTQIDFLDEINRKYARLSGRQLETLTNREAPWRDTYGDRPPGSRCVDAITHAAMTDFYGDRVRAAA